MDAELRTALDLLEPILKEAQQNAEEVKDHSRDELLSDFGEMALALAMVRASLKTMSDAAETLVADVLRAREGQLAYEGKTHITDVLQDAVDKFNTNFKKGL